MQVLSASNHLPRLLVVLFSVCILCTSCSPRRPTPAPNSPNVLLILIDTLRADKLGCYGNRRGLTPNIDSFSEQGTLFKQAFSHAPWTLPSCASLITSTYPDTHGAGSHQGGELRFSKLRPEIRTLAECFRDQGYETEAIVNVLFLSPKFGMGRGFDKYDFVPPQQNQNERRADEVTDIAIQRLNSMRSTNRPFFFLVHYFDPHLTYDPPPEFRERFAGILDRKPGKPLFGTAGQMIALRNGQISIDSIPISRLEKLHHGEIASTDHQVGRLLETLTKYGLDESTLVILTADHGEEFLDHDGFEHGHTLYDEMIHVPLILRQPGKVKPRVVTANVGHIDVAPTLCKLAGIKPETTFRGRNLEPLLHGDPIVEQPVFSQGNMWGPSLESWRQDGYKLIKKPTGIELFNVTADPRERRNLASDPSQVARRQRMLNAMNRTIDQARSTAATTEGVKLNKAERDNFRSLGYAGDDDENSAEQTDRPTSTPATRKNH